MICIIKQISKNSLKFDPTYNSNFIEHLVLSIKDQGMKLFNKGSKYGMDKVKAGYVSDIEDLIRPKSGYTTPVEGGLINVE